MFARKVQLCNHSQLENGHPSNLCEYFVSIHGQHKILNTNRKCWCNLEMGVHIQLQSRLEIGGDASSIVDFGYQITDDYCNRR